MKENKFYVYYKLKNGSEISRTLESKDIAQSVYDSVDNEKWKIISDTPIPSIFEQKEKKRFSIKGDIIWLSSYIISLFGLHYIWEYVDTLEFGSPQPSSMDTVVGIALSLIVATIIKNKFTR